MITEEFIDDSYWNAPINIEIEKFKERFEYLFKNYCSFLEVNPTISNYNLTEIVVFDDLDLYIVIAFLKHCKFNYHLDIDKEKISSALSAYLFS